MIARIYDSSPVWLQNVFCTLEGFRLLRFRYGKQFWERLAFLRESKNWSASDLLTFQLQELNKLIVFARTNVPYYRSLFTRLGFDAGSLNSLEELKSLPILEKETVYQEWKKLMPTRDAGVTIYKGRTSGTTGTALPIHFSKEALIDEFATIWRLREELGIHFGDLQATFNGRKVVPLIQEQPPYWRKNYAFNQHLFSQYHLNPKTVSTFVHQLTTTPYIYWSGYPSFMGVIVRWMVNHGITTFVSKPKAIFTSSETLTTQVRKTLRDATGATVRDRYGSGEFIVSMTECEFGRLHVDMEMGVVEVEAVEVSKDKVSGPLIVTGLRNFGMPLIRYRIGDTGTQLLTPCPCGRAGQTFEHIDGRVEDYVITPEGNKIGRLDHVFKNLFNIQEAQIVQERIDQIRVLIVRRPTFSSADEKDLKRELRERLGDRVDFILEYTDFIPRLPNGKFRFVVSKIKNDYAF